MSDRSNRGPGRRTDNPDRTRSETGLLQRLRRLGYLPHGASPRPDRGQGDLRQEVATGVMMFPAWTDARPGIPITQTGRTLIMISIVTDAEITAGDGAAAAGCFAALPGPR